MRSAGIATASSDERLERLKPLGMTHGINYRTHDVVEEVIRITNKKGADVVVDSVGGPTLQGSMCVLMLWQATLGAALPQRIDTGIDVITRENVDAHLAAAR